MFCGGVAARPREIAIEGEEQQRRNQHRGEQTENAGMVLGGQHKSGGHAGNQERQARSEGPAARRLCGFPGMNGSAVEPAERSKKRGQPEQIDVSHGGGSPGRNRGAGGKDRGDREFVGKPEPNFRQVRGGEIHHRRQKDPRVFPTCGRGHAKDNEPCQGDDGERGTKQQRTAMARMKKVALAQIDAQGSGTAVEQTVHDVEQPGAEAQNREYGPGDGGGDGAGEAPRPEGGDAGSVEAEQMPIDGNDVQTRAPACAGARE